MICGKESAPFSECSLGHGSLDMVQHYARIAQVDVENAHRRASPADNWHL